MTWFSIWEILRAAEAQQPHQAAHLLEPWTQLDVSTNVQRSQSWAHCIFLILCWELLLLRRLYGSLQGLFVGPRGFGNVRVWTIWQRLKGAMRILDIVISFASSNATCHHASSPRTHLHAIADTSPSTSIALPPLTSLLTEGSETHLQFSPFPTT